MEDFHFRYGNPQSFVYRWPRDTFRGPRVKGGGLKVFNGALEVPVNLSTFFGFPMTDPWDERYIYLIIYHYDQENM